MTDERQGLLATLKNQGFAEAERWVDYARDHGFQQIRSQRVSRCPNCGTESHTQIGQYVYYSTLMRLNLCAGCGLAYSDRRIDPLIIRTHFEGAYKDEDYFLDRRSWLFDQLARLVDGHAPSGGSVLDIGGAKGHLMAVVQRRRPDLHITISDLSKSACTWAATTYGFKTICSAAGALHVDQAFDVVVMSDVIYYEPEPAKLWTLLPNLVAPGGIVIIRVPNRLLLIRLAQAIRRFVTSKRARDMRDRIMFFNPEHLFIFSRRLLTRRLSSLGFDPVTVLPSELLTPGAQTRRFHTLYYQVARLVHLGTLRRLTITPSLLLVGRRPLPAHRGGVERPSA